MGEVTLTGLSSNKILKNDPNVKVNHVEFDAAQAVENAKKYDMDSFRLCTLNYEDMSKFNSAKATETITKRMEFVRDDSMPENCACLYTYLERTLIFESDELEGGKSTFTMNSMSSTFVTADNCVFFADNYPWEKGNSEGIDFSKVGYACMETTETREASFEKNSITASGSYAELMADEFGDGKAWAGAFGYAEENSLYKYNSSKTSKAIVAYKNGTTEKYISQTDVSREKYNRCAAYVAAAVGVDTKELTLDDKDFKDMFGKLDRTDRDYPEKKCRRHEKRNDMKHKLRRHMTRHLDNERRDNNSIFAKMFTDAYMKLGNRSYNDISAIVDKYFL